jgi:two-component system, response regulator / RNA-binding antiterminator
VVSAERLRIVLVDDQVARSSDLERALVEAGYEVAARLAGGDDLRARVAELSPDLLIVDLQSPDRDVLEDMQRMHHEQPRPMVMFVDESDSQSIQTAVRAGVSAYVVGGLPARRIRPIVEVAIARFQEFQSLRTELAETRERLDQRKLIDRAKGILMSKRGVSEDEAYRLLRKAAMDRKARLAEVARNVIELAELL